ncbi:glutathione S-transferase [Legionella geestiana]|uniref:Glutathione S-transferase n=1 Tax=Legionella geestiana TaxID=45065 RepID=A0A0W0TUH9_9GAMM|nr:glutathione transferase GstA [Legionella geestiana]KTC99300.1 glutathione S-transferase [Legionella geestiana]QBS11986.1 glutathione transferase GstA [Legionella geestiana]STX53300.1 glutathione S-transferase [Legionella geestiana]
MKLYYSRGACSMVTRIVLNELGVTYTAEAVDLRTKTSENSTDFREINPKGSVPVIVLDNGAILTEGQVILQYLCDTYQGQALLPEVGNFSRYRVLEWLNYISTELHKGFAPLFNPAMPEDIKKQFFIPALEARFAFVNQHLTENAYMAGAHYSIADAYLFVMLSWCSHCGIKLTGLEALLRLQKTLAARAAIIKALKDEGFGA